MSLCITQPMPFSPLCFDHLVLAPHSANREACSRNTPMRSFYEKYVAHTSCQSCHSRLVPPSGVSEACAATLEKYRPLSTDDASRASPELTLCDSGLALRTTLQLCHFPNLRRTRLCYMKLLEILVALFQLRMVSSKILVALFRQRSTCELCQRCTVSWRLLAEV